MMDSVINIFLPTFLLTAAHRGARSGLLFGYRRVDARRRNRVNVNITALLPYSSLHQLTNLLKTEDLDAQDEEEPSRMRLHFLGELHDDSSDETGRDLLQHPPNQEYQPQLTVLRHHYRSFQLILSFTGASCPSSSTDCSTIDAWIDSESESALLKAPRTYSHLELTSIHLSGRQITNFKSTTLIYYDTRNFMCSQLLRRFNFGDNRVEFVDFIYETLKHTAQLIDNNSESVSNHHSQHSHHSHHPHHSHHSHPSHPHGTEDPLTLLVLTRLILLMPRRLIRAFVYLTSPQRSRAQQLLNPISSVSSSVPSSQNHSHRSILYPIIRYLTDLLSFITDWSTLSMSLTQLKFRFLQYTICWRLLREIPRRRISLSLGNVMSSVALDTLLGLAAITALHYYSTPTYWLQQAWRYADAMVEHVDQLLRLLQSMPAGLKLNRPLNQALSQFYLYHIYLWESYMDIIRPIFALVMQAIFYCGLFGFTCILSLLSDIFSLVTIHIYCFYGYGCQLYNFQVSGISALWRLFRGKKWNQLRSRVDSYSYDNEQLFIGTILFTILLFLLPTVFMYYLVFLVLRFMTLAVQEGLFFFIEHISSMPLYSLFLWLCNSRTITGRVYFDILSDPDDDEGPPGVDQPQADQDEQPDDDDDDDHLIQNNIGNNHHHHHQDPPPHHWASNRAPMVVLLKTERVSLFKIISSRYDDMLRSLHDFRQTTAAKELTWSEFAHSILTGRVLNSNMSVGLSLLLFIGYMLAVVYYLFFTSGTSSVTIPASAISAELRFQS